MVRLEAKAATHLGRRDTTGIAAFRASYPGANVGMGLVICARERPLRIAEDCWAVPWDLAG
ncbi:MAG: hypothetical protein ABIO70_09615 [Pseudomonadota bacterium]